MDQRVNEFQSWKDFRGDLAQPLHFINKEVEIQRKGPAQGQREDSRADNEMLRLVSVPAAALYLSL